MRKLISLVLVFFVLGLAAFCLVVRAQVKDDVSDSSALPVEGYSSKVVKVVDGDTLVLSNGEKIRLIGVDTPEIAHPLKSVQYFAKEAGSFTKTMVEGKKVRLELDWQKRDKYDRLLAYVYLKDGTFLNAEIIKQGYGFAYTRFPFKYLEEFRRYQKEARENNRGLWCGGGEAELRWLEARVREPFRVYKMANDLWGVKFKIFVRTRVSNDELVPILEEAEVLANGCHERDLEMELLRRGWKKDSDEPPEKLEVISWMDAHKYYGEKVIVEGTVVAAFNSGKACFLNFHKNWKKYFTAVIFQSASDKFPEHPELYYKDKKVRITGVIKEYKGQPEIVLKHPSQIKVVDSDS